MKTFVAMALAGVVAAAAIGVPCAWAEHTIVLGRTVVKFDRRGIYDYRVPVSETKASAHNGEVVVD
jgi:hypothetical protein